MRKATDDVMAREAAEALLYDRLDEQEAADPRGTAKAIVGEFKAAEFETGTSKDPDRNAVPMRRLVLTGPWVIDPNPPAPAE